jgi:hypothetical protein
MPNTYKKNPIQDLYNIVPLLTQCDPTKTPSNCSCTDPSYGYSKPCTLSSTSANAPKGNSVRSKCYYTQPVNQGLAKSTGGSLAQKANKQFSVKPGNTDRQFFTQPSSVTQPNTSIGAATTYPTSLLFCAYPEEDATSAAPTNPTQALSYDKASGFGTSWNTSTENKTSNNLGFA